MLALAALFWKSETKETFCSLFSGEETTADKPKHEKVNWKMYVCSSVFAGSGEKAPNPTFWLAKAH